MQSTREDNKKIVNKVFANDKVVKKQDRVLKESQSNRVLSNRNTRIHKREGLYVDLGNMEIKRFPKAVKKVDLRCEDIRSLRVIYSKAKGYGIKKSRVYNSKDDKLAKKSVIYNHRQPIRQTAYINRRIVTKNETIKDTMLRQKDSSTNNDKIFESSWKNYANHIKNNIRDKRDLKSSLSKDKKECNIKSNENAREKSNRDNKRINGEKGVPVKTYQYSKKVARTTGAAVITEARIASAMTETDGSKKETPINMIKNQAKQQARNKVMVKAKRKTKEVAKKATNKVSIAIKKIIRNLVVYAIKAGAMLGAGIMSILSIVGLPLIAIVIVVSVILIALGSDMTVTTSPPLYTVYDSNWCKLSYGKDGGTISSDGSIVCTVAMLTTYLQNDEEITPITTREWMKNDYYISPGGIDPKIYSDVANKYGYIMQEFDSFNDDAISVIDTNIEKALDEMMYKENTGNTQSAVTIIAITKPDTVLGKKSIPVLITSKSNEYDASYRVNSPMDTDKLGIYYMDFYQDDMDDLFSKFYIFTKGETTVNTATQGEEICEYAKGFVGAPYKLGGEDIKNGIDCSAFTKFIYAHFGYTLPRTSTAQRDSGTAVEESDLQPGDLVCYDGHVAIYLGDGKVISAESKSVGVKIEDSIRYCSNKVIGFRRIVTASSKKMIWPISSVYTRMSTEYGVADAFGNPGHCGIDLPAPEGTPIYAAADGKVVASTFATSTGNYVKIDHGNGISTVYMHASRLIASVGQTVKAGDVIALVGTTGPSTGNHLHFSVQLNGVYVNPHPYFANDLSWM